MTTRQKSIIWPKLNILCNTTIIRKCYMEEYYPHNEVIQNIQKFEDITVHFLVNVWILYAIIITTFYLTSSFKG